jgi:membrane fusion protein (multidrug efflux system)
MKTFTPLLAALAVLAACGKPPPPASTGNGPRTVVVAEVKSAILASSLPLPGQLLPYESVDIYPKVNGFIREITVDRGSHVRAGQVLVLLTAPELNAQKEQVAGVLRATQARLIGDRATYERLANAARTPGIVAENDVDVARQVASADEAQVASARQSVRSLSEQESYLRVRAPFDGVVTARNLHPGALVGPATGQAQVQPILQIVKDDRLRLAIAVPEADAQDVIPGQAVTFTVPGAPGRKFQAPIRRIAQALEARTRTMMVELDVSNADREIRSGEFATVKWPVRRRYPTLQVPSTAVANDQQRQFVIRIANGVATWIDVSTGMTDDDQIEVFGDLKPGDRVVRRATDAIQPGTRVQVAAR